LRALLVLLAALLLAPLARAETVGSKAFTESVILGEIAKATLDKAGVPTTHRRELGGSRILFDAVKARRIDFYPEYTGTLRFELLAAQHLPNDAALGPALAAQGLALTRPLGFSDSYGIAMRADKAKALGITKLSDLAQHRDLRFGFSNEFVDRKDGWPALAAAYGLTGVRVQGINHDLAYRALDARQIDLTDAYTTDAEIAAYNLVVLADDAKFFPPYDAVFVIRSDLSPKARAALDSLAGTIDEPKMRALNRLVRMDKQTETAAARAALGGGAGVDNEPTRLERIAQRTVEHLALVAAALAAALLVAVPLGVLAARQRRIGGIVLAATGVLQTIPSLALFVVLIPLLGIGAAPTIFALFLYSLLPIVRNTHAGLTGIPQALLDSADALGLTRAARLRRIELPLALPTIVAGVRTAAVIAVGLATLGAIIGAGGYGQPILTGIRLNSTPLILEGAIPAALLALGIEALFGLAKILARRVP
jgi:osmoprotectant transport system permease protein